MTPHNEALKEDIASYVIMPGDPKRATEIAEMFLTDYKLVNSVRGELAYTGYYDGVKVTVQASGMGNPSMGIYSYELFKFYDVDLIIRVGTAGSYSSELKLSDTFLVTSSYSKSTYANVAYHLEDEVIESDSVLNNKIIDTAIDSNFKLTTGRVYSSDVFYEKIDEDIIKNKKCLSVEMETFALFSNAFALGKRASALLTISDNLVTGEAMTAFERQTNFKNTVKLALDTIKSIESGKNYQS